VTIPEIKNATPTRRTNRIEPRLRFSAIFGITFRNPCCSLRLAGEVGANALMYS
jgi:hypothetical protein